MGGTTLLPIFADAVACAAAAEPTVNASRTTPDRNPLPTLTFITPPDRGRADRPEKQSPTATGIGVTSGRHRDPKGSELANLAERDVEALLCDSSPEVRESLSELVPSMYDELRRLARRILARERRNHTLQPSALVHEAYMRLAAQRGQGFVSRAHFLALAARMMRRILVDHARRRNADRRGGGSIAVTLDEDILVAAPEAGVDILRLHEALKELSRLDPRQGRVVELRFFGGLTVEETAGILEISEPTVNRDWQTARIFLRHALRSEGPP